MKARKLPIVIDVWPVEKVLTWLEASDDDYTVAELPTTEIVEAMGQRVLFHDEGVVYVETAEGTMKAWADGWIARGVEGEWYPIKKSVFEATYEVLP